MRFRPSNTPDDETDMLICAGHSNDVLIYHNGEVRERNANFINTRENSCHPQKISNIKTSDWPHAITLGDVNSDGEDELVLGSLDQTIEVFEWKQ